MKPGFVLTMARRESRASGRRLMTLALAIAAGVAALVAVNGFTSNLRTSVARQAQAMLGADLSVESRSELGSAARALLDSLGGDQSPFVAFSAMSYAPAGTTARLTQVTAIGSGWPWYGAIRTSPVSAWGQLGDGRNAVVDPSLLRSLGVEVGDSIALGETRFRVIGSITEAPGDVGIRSALGPRAFIPFQYLDATGLLGFGARAEYGSYVQLEPGADAQRIAADWRPRLREERARIRTVADDRDRLDNALTRLGNFLGLVALIALLLGGLGVASAITVHIRRRIDTVAVLRCLGATGRQVFGIYLTQAALLGLAGGVLGAVVGLLAQQLVPLVVADLVPADLDTGAAWGVALAGVLLGGWTALVFALLPLLSIRRVTPLAALRRDVDPIPSGRDPARLAAIALLVMSVVTLAVLQAGNWRAGLGFAAGIGVALLGLRIAAGLVIGLARRLSRAPLAYTSRQGLANLQRPGNQTVAVVLALGFGTFLLAALALTQHNLLATLDVSGEGAARPNLALFDIQPSQLAGVRGVLEEAGVPMTAPVPMVPMRVASVRGKQVSLARRPDSLPDDSLPRGWAVRREYRSTWRDTLVASEKLLSGTWWDGRAAGGPARISIERDVAEELGVGLGDDITWDVQGRPVPTRITSIREVDWARFEPNFFVVFEPGVLEDAPQTWVTMARVDDPVTRSRLPRQIAEQWPNVTSLDLTVVQQAIEDLLGRVSLAIRFMALFSLVAGLVVLGGTVATSRDQRIRESALLRTLGARARQLYRIVVVEYAALGLMAGLAAALLAVAAGWALARFLFEIDFTAPPLALAVVVLVPGALAALVGAWASRDVVHRTPLETLRRAAE